MNPPQIYHLLLESPEQGLRATAAHMRDAALKAEPGRWKVWGMTVMADPAGSSDVDQGIGVARAFSPSGMHGKQRTFNADFISSWDPATALSVADLLDNVKCTLRCDDTGRRVPHCSKCSDSTEDHDCPPAIHCEHSVNFRLAVNLAKTHIYRGSQ